MKSLLRNGVLILFAFIVPSIISWWSLAGFDQYWKYPAEFGFYGLVIRCVIPALIGLGILLLAPELRKRPIVLILYTIAMIVWLYFPFVLFVVAMACGLTGNCL